jgi:hypothetical protein
MGVKSHCDREASRIVVKKDLIGEISGAARLG